MNIKTVILKNKPKAFIILGIILLLPILMPLFADYKDFFLFIGISSVIGGIILRFFNPKTVYWDASETIKIPTKTEQTSLGKQILKLPFPTKQSPVSLLLFLVIIGGVLLNQLLISRYNTQTTKSTSVQPAENIPKNSLNPTDQSLVTEIRQQGQEVPVLNSAHNHADLNIYIDSQRLILADAKNYMKSAFLHIDNNQNLNDANSVLHMHAKNVPLWLFFKSLGMNLTKDSLKLANGQVFKNGNGKTLKFYLNGQKVDELANYSFQPLDKLLISFGPDNDPNVQEQIKIMTNFAKDHQK